MRLLLLGRTGQVGYELQRALVPLGVVVALNRQSCDLADAAALRRTLRDVAADVVVNAAAYTAVDRAEREPNLAQAINGVAPGILGEEAARSGALVVHYSTDYVFDGTSARPYVESDAPNPLNVYGRSKLAGEVALRQSGASHLIFRTSWVVGAHGGNFVKTILRLAGEKTSLNVVADQWGAPTSARLIAETTASVIGRFAEQGTTSFPFGLYHLTARGETNWHQLARHVVATAVAAGRGLTLAPEAIQAIPTAEYPLPAARPLNSRLCTDKLRSTFGVELPDWREALAPVLDEILLES